MHTHTHTHQKNGTRDEVREKWWLNNEQKFHKNSLVEARRSRGRRKKKEEGERQNKPKIQLFHR
jgi:hypothetical protein